MKSWKESHNKNRFEMDDNRLYFKVCDNLNNISLSLQRIIDLDEDFLKKYFKKSNIDFLRDVYYKIDSMISDIN